MKLKQMLIAFLFLSLAATAQDDEIDSSNDRILVEKAVVHWADSVFYKHSEYKFENFRAEYSEGYYIAVMRSRAYKEQVTDLEADKAAGRYKGTEEAYQKELQELKDRYSKAQVAADTYVLRADYYLIHFWSNIQTTDGITVYYEHILKLDNSYRVIEATVNSAIGKKDANTQILYKKDVKGTTTDKKKLDESPRLDTVNDTPDKTNAEPVKETESSAPSKKDKKKKKK